MDGQLLELLLVVHMTMNPSGANQEEEPTAEPMDLIPYNPPEDRGPVYSHF